MKKSLLLCLCMVAFSMVNCASAQKINLTKALQAGSELITAVSITDQDIVSICQQAVAKMDEENEVAPAESKYAKRLDGLVSGLGNYDGLNLNFKVYVTDEINAFACGDGSVRVYSGLMDIMTDDELMAVVGHEIGHVKNQDTKDAIKNAYLSSAARNAVGSTGGTIGKLSDSVLGDITLALTSARYSQKQENDADTYGFNFSVKNGFDPYGMSNSMDKLAKLSQGDRASAVQQMFSSHPDNLKRAQRTRTMADEYVKSQNL